MYRLSDRLCETRRLICHLGGWFLITQRPLYVAPSAGPFRTNYFLCYDKRIHRGGRGEGWSYLESTCEYLPFYVKGRKFAQVMCLILYTISIHERAMAKAKFKREVTAHRGRRARKGTTQNKHKSTSDNSPFGRTCRQRYMHKRKQHKHIQSR